MAGRLLIAAALPLAAFALGRQPAGASAPFRQTLTNFGNAQYVAYMSVGSQRVAGIVDTGSSDLVVFPSSCSSCGPSARYDGRASSTFVDGALESRHAFGNGAAVCTSGQEQISIGPFSARSQTFWAAQQADAPLLQNAAFEAVIGLAPPEYAMTQAWQDAVAAVEKLTGFYDSGELASKAQVQEAKDAVDVAKKLTNGAPMLRALTVGTFGICLGALPGSDGVLVWNDDSVKEHPQLFSEVPVVGNGTWRVPLADATLSGRRGSVNLRCPDNRCEALLDTSSSLLGVPRAVKSQIEEAMEELNEDCSNLDVLPTLHFKLGEASVSLTADAYVGTVTGDDAQTPGVVLNRLPAGSPRRACRLLLVETDGSEEAPLWVLGAPFFRKYYTAFSLGASVRERRVHVAPHADDCDLAQTRPSLLVRRGMEPHAVDAARLRLPRLAAVTSTPKLRA